MIAWFNQNEGFVSALLSLFTIMLSVVAIFVSIRTAKLPYKKGMIILAGREISSLGEGLYVTAINTGNRPIKISMIGLMIAGKQFFAHDQIATNQIIVHTGETTEHHLLLSELQKVLPKTISMEEKIYAYAKDVEGCIYKKKIEIVRDIYDQL